MRPYVMHLFLDYIRHWYDNVYWRIKPWLWSELSHNQGHSSVRSLILKSTMVKTWATLHLLLKRKILQQLLTAILIRRIFIVLLLLSNNPVSFVEILGIRGPNARPGTLRAIIVRNKDTFRKFVNLRRGRGDRHVQMLQSWNPKMVLFYWRSASYSFDRQWKLWELCI